MRLPLISSFLVFAFHSMNAVLSAQLPNTNVLLFDTEKKEGAIALSAPRFLTAWNRAGYNNQPAFVGEDLLLLAVGTPDDTTQTEIWELNLAARTRKRVTQTAESEFSPTPLADGPHFSSVLIEADGHQTQRLWEFPLDRSAAGHPVFEKISGVGYHVWLRDTLAALFLVEKPMNRLITAGLRGQQPTVVAFNPGRSLHRLADGRLAFIAKPTEQTWYIKSWDPRTKTGDILCKTRPASEDFCVMADGSFLMGEGPRLYRLRPGKDLEWSLVGDLSTYGVKTVTRLAASKEGRLAVVVQ